MPTWPPAQAATRAVLPSSFSCSSAALAASRIRTHLDGRPASEACRLSRLTGRRPRWQRAIAERTLCDR
eukprot:967560-Prymnesium_polylepis.1